MNCKNKMFNFLISLCSVGFSSISNVAAEPGDFLVYFVGHYPDRDNNLSRKSCCVCNENLAERCLQFCCEKECKLCSAGNMSAYFDRANSSYRSSGCKHVKKWILEKIKSNGYFCFVDYNEHNEYAFCNANWDNRLCCAYCMRKYLRDKYPTKKGIDARNLIDNKFKLGDKCLICLQKLQETDKLTYCKNCKKQVLHFQCASTWWNQKHSCPICRSDTGMEDGTSNIDCKSFNNIGATEDFILPEYDTSTEECLDCYFEKYCGSGYEE